MILRKPYALLIKYFRIIHFILAILIGYVIFKTSNLLYFLNNYIQRGYVDITTSLTKQYTSYDLFIVISLVIIGNIIIYFLMRFKNKPRLFYFITIVSYIIALIIFGRTYFNLQVMTEDVIDPRVIRLTRDIIMIFSFMQYYIIANTLFTATGFNIKKFNFQEDLEELNIGSADNEEFEFVLGFNFDKFKVKLRRLGRNIHYIFLENIIVLLTIIGIVVLLTAGYIIFNTQVINKAYNENQVFNTYKYKINIVSSYITDKDYKGNVINKGYDYLVVQFNLTNMTDLATQLNDSALLLNIKSKKYYTENISPSLFMDLGTVYNGQVLPVKVEKSFIVVYKIAKEYEKQNMNLQVLSNFVGNEMKYVKVRLKPRNMITTDLVTTKSLKEEMNFSDSMLKNTKLTINEFELKDQFIYKYKLCIMNECNDMSDYIFTNTLTPYDKTTLRLGLKFSLDKNFKGNVPNNAYELIQTFGTIRYYKNGQIINHNVAINSLTPKYYTGDSIYIDVLKDMETADKIDILFNIRDKQYIYIIKNK